MQPTTSRQSVERSSLHSAAVGRYRDADLTGSVPYSGAVAHDPDHLSEAEVATAFRQLQHQLRDRWTHQSLGDRHNQDLVIIPSISLDPDSIKTIEGVGHYEERLLISLLQLQHPNTRIIYVTSQPIHPRIIEYYLSLIPEGNPDHARCRLQLLSVYDSSDRPLSAKVLERPRLMQRIRQALRPGRAVMTCFNATDLERRLSVGLGIPLFATDPALQHWGTKSGSRKLFAACDVPHPAGTPLQYTIDDLAQATVQLWEQNPALKRIVIKLDEGVSGQGNALLDLRSLHHLAPIHDSAQPPTEVDEETPAPGRQMPHHADRIQAILTGFTTMSFQSEDVTWANFSRRIPEMGALAEAFVEGDDKRSPSVQVSILPDGQVEVLSTHDQILGGPDGQTYFGCRFPADETYRLLIQSWGLRIGQMLAEKGALERLAVDFIAVHHPEAVGTDDEWDLYAIEINLRKGGTTHPYMTLTGLASGHYAIDDGQFHSQGNRPKVYIASDHVMSANYQGLMPDDLLDIATHRRLMFQSRRQTGPVFHMMGCLSEYGKLGVTCIGNSMEEAEAIHEQVLAILDEETQPLLAQPVLAPVASGAMA